MTTPFSNFLKIKASLWSSLQIFSFALYFGENSYFDQILCRDHLENTNVLGRLSAHKEPFHKRIPFKSFKIFTGH